MFHNRKLEGKQNNHSSVLNSFFIFDEIHFSNSIFLNYEEKHFMFYNNSTFGSSMWHEDKSWPGKQDTQTPYLEHFQPKLGGMIKSAETKEELM